MPQDHPYRRLCIPKGAPFELRPSSPGKGWGAFATRLIKQRDPILIEEPLFIIRKPSQYITDQDVFAAFQQLTPAAKQQFLLIRDNASGPFGRLSELLAENAFALLANAGHGLYLLHSRFNHSCIPNAKVPESSSETLTLFAIKEIVAGEEITFCYNADFEGRTRRERHEALRFACDCKACLPGTPFQQLSDVRRRFVRGLQYLAHGIDIDGRRQDSSSPIIDDRKLKEAAENLSIPLCNKLIYQLLSSFLLEEEGLLDYLMRERIERPMVILSSLFETESNARIVKVAMTEQTLLGKVHIAFRLYGRADAADELLPEMLRMLRRI
ncbi:SET domain-containing protein [Daldinia decipiens]|uniref:SET domain-containing protein n=1 Tax=Daldinia decipiens TaxID=326647 RepID=UPI0020C45601|nr:SET domain-containing protein [Daldinia decipiens]KAI1658935.1 SET domain-containing protein [Daldinia decipiens]